MTTPRFPDPDVSAYDANVAHLAKTTTTHTPGPWTIHTDRGQFEVGHVKPDTEIRGNGGARVVVRLGRYYNAADARLIAQAPAMVAILREAVQDSVNMWECRHCGADADGEGCKSPACWVGRARAILRAIEGGTNG
jgi:hypothetical protein